jgi:hypothetical protein
MKMIVPVSMSQQMIHDNIEGSPLRFSVKGCVWSSTWMNTASHKQDIPSNYHLKSFFNLFVYREKSKDVRKKWKMTFSLNVRFNGSVINLLGFRHEATLGPSLVTDHEQLWL